MSHGPDWTLYRTLLAVLQEGTLSGAARRLGLTQPTVGRHIDALEQALGATLFLRSPRGLAPSELASRLRPYAETLEATASALWRAASEGDREVRGVVRVSASEVMGVERLPPVLAQLRQRHPGLAVELVLSNEVQDLLQREADVAVRNTEPQQEALVAQRLPDVELGLFAHRGYLERRGAPASRAELSEHDLVGFDTESPVRRRVLAAFPELARSSFALGSDSDLMQLAAIRAGMGLGVCQVALAQGELVRVLPEVRFELGLWIVMHEDLRSSARCRAVFDALVAGLSP